MAEITEISFKEVLNALLESNPHARSKGNKFKGWCNKNFKLQSRISHIKEQRQTTNRVSEQFRYYDPIVVFVCDPKVKRDELERYIFERTYKQLATVAIIGVTQTKRKNAREKYKYTFEKLFVLKNNDFSSWAEPLFSSVIDVNGKNDQGLNILADKSGVLQAIFFGAPGTGKSYMIKHEVIPSDIVPYRVTFYPDYYYSDFVGGLRPKKDDKGNGVCYEFEPGPFAKALKDSFTKRTFLIIEEINRGNAAAIFGDIFQLLDRKGGKSEYTITNKELYDYLVKEGVEGLVENTVYLPTNLNILCTMNTADQNVFVLDTAFKRRFKMVYVPIDFNAFYEDGKFGGTVKENCEGYIDNTDIFNGEKYESDLSVVMTPELFESVKSVVGEPKRDWRTFAAYVNAKIDSINSIEQKISEDKKLGPFFVDPIELLSRQAFADKVIYYLKQDVFKYEDNVLVDSYESLYAAFVNKKKDLFEIFQNPR